MKKVLVLVEKNISLKRIKADKVLVATKVPYLFQDTEDLRIELISLEDETLMPSEETWRLLDIINGIINKSCNEKNKWKYEPSYHIEGSGLAQNCADIISAAKIIIDIINKYDINEIVMYPDEQNLIECMLVHEISKKFRIHVKSRYAGLKNMLVTCNHNKIIYEMKKIFYIINLVIKYFRISRNAKGKEMNHITESDIAIFHASDSKKSIGWKEAYIYDLVRAIKSSKLVCLNTPNSAKYFREKGFLVEKMEEYLTLESIKQRKREYILFINKIKKINNEDICYFYNNVKISKIFNYYICVYLYHTIPRNLYVDAVCSDYFKYNKFKIINCHGDSNFIETRAVYYNTRNAATKIYGQDGLPIFIVPRYEPYQDIISVRFFCNNSNRYEELLECGWKGQAYFIEDITYIPRFVEKYSKRKKENESKIKSVVWAPSYVVKGLTTCNAFITNNERIMSWFERNRCSLIVKYHPNQIMSQIQNFIKLYSDSQYVQIVDKKEAFDKFLQEADIVITDKSLCIFDAIVAGKPVMVLCSKLHYKLIGLHEKGINIYMDTDELFKELAELESNPTYYEKWRSETVKKQDTYFMEYHNNKNGIYAMIEILNSEIKKFDESIREDK